MARNKIKYNKPPLSFDEQVDQLEERGMTIADRELTKFYLSHLNYYRLGAYWLPFEADHNTHKFKSGTCFDKVLNLYIFDRELRLLVMNAIERIEVSMRTQFAYHLSIKYGAHFHLKPELFSDRLIYSRSIFNLQSDVDRSKEQFVNHLKSKYSDLLPPAWAVVELMTLGQLSKWYKNLKIPSDRQLIATVYDMDETLLQTFIHILSHIRNICAHHSRLWNKQLTYQISYPKKRPSPIINCFNKAAPKNIYNYLVLTAWMMDKISPDHSWKTRLFELIEQHHIEPSKMGFPTDYRTLSIWSSTHSA